MVVERIKPGVATDRVAKGSARAEGGETLPTYRSMADHAFLA